MPQLISEEETDVMYSVDESDNEPMSIEMLEDICDGIQYHPRVNMRAALYKIHDCVKSQS